MTYATYDDLVTRFGEMKLTQLTEKRKQLQERALLEKISEIAPTYDDAQTLLDLLAAERPSAATKDGGNAHDNEREPPRD